MRNNRTEAVSMWADILGSRLEPSSCASWWLLLKFDWNFWLRCSLWHHLSSNLTFYLPHRPPSKPKEILIALIPNQSIFIQYQDSCNYTHRPRAHNWNPTFHSSEPSFLASVLHLSLLLFFLFVLPDVGFAFLTLTCLRFSLDSLSDLCLYRLVFFFLKPPPPTPPCRKAGMCQTVASL